MTTGAAADRSSGAALPRGLTQELARYACGSSLQALPQRVRDEAARAFLNWVGCVLGGCREDAVRLAAETVAELGGGTGPCSIVGHAQRTDMASAAFVNCIASSVQAFDDAHLATVTHPSGPVGAALLAFSQTRVVSGAQLMNAFALGIEVTCRLANALVLTPSQFNLGFYVTGLTAPIGVALAVGRLLQLDEQKLNWAIGLAASQGSGFRATHGTMTAHFRPGHGARCGVWSALLAARGFDSDAHALEAPQGFFDVYSAQAVLERAVEGLGRDFELLSNAYKPYPCGIVIHATLDACLDVHRQAGPGAKPVHAKLRVNPLALKLTGVRHPRTPLESHVSIYHWAAASLLRGSAGLPETQLDCIDDAQVMALREQVEAIADPTIGREQAIVDVTYADGRLLSATVTDARGSRGRPMTDVELDAKFRGQALTVLVPEAVDELLGRCRALATLSDVGRELGASLERRLPASA
jgi:2-methylcitrate dehydratase PrpD